MSQNIRVAKMGRIPTLVGAILLSFLCSSGVANGQTPSDSTQAKPTKNTNPKKSQRGHAHDAKKHDGAELYARYCALCHGEDREGYAADDSPSLRSPELMGSAPGGFLWSAIYYGRPGTPMAAFADTQGGPLSHDEQHALMDWLIKSAKVIRNPIKDVPVVGDAQKGSDIYAKNCADCHGAKGEGGTGTALANPVYLATASDSFIRHSIAKGRSGTPMNAFVGRLSDQDINNVVAFLRSRALGWEATDPVLAAPPDPTKAVLNPNAVPAQLDEREGRFVSAESVSKAMERGERMVLLDARPMSDWQRSHLPGALPMPFYDGVEELVPHLPKDDTPIIAYCACPHAASGRVVDKLKKAGFTNARILDEGVIVWAGRGYPLAIGEAAAKASR